jgi:hypothetical protein
LELAAYKEEILFKLTGGVLECELDDKALTQVLNAALREVQRYIDTTVIKTIPFENCIDLSDYNVSSVSRVYRAKGFMANESSESTPTPADPMYASQWQLLSGTGNMYNFNDYVYNYAAYNTLQQIRNTTSTDLAFRYDKSSNKLYINIATSKPQSVTIEYVPRYKDVSEITSDYWIDIIVRLATAIAKVTLGRIRTRYTQSNALWTQDGQQMLDEGNAELTDIREKLQASTQLCYPID